MRVAYLMILGAALALPGCGGSTRELRLTLTPAADMNDARSCYVLARAIDGKAFSTETYDDVAGMAMAPDDSVLSALAVLPGVRQVLMVPLPEKGRVAIYALFKQRLYLFYSAANREAFLLAPDAAGRAAEEKWPELAMNLSIN